MMMTAGEDMAEFMGKQDGKQSEGKRQAGSEGNWMLVEKFEGVEKFVDRNGLILSVGDGKLSAGDEASAESEEKKNTSEIERPNRRTRWHRGVGRFEESNSVPIQVDGNGWRRIF